MRDAIQRLNEAPGDVTRGALYREIVQGVLLLVAVQGAGGFDGSSMVPKKALGADFRFLTIRSPQKKEALVAFSDLDALQALAPGATPVAMASHEVVELSRDRGLDGLVLNPAGPWAAVPGADIPRILGS